MKLTELLLQRLGESEGEYTLIAYAFGRFLDRSMFDCVPCKHLAQDIAHASN